MSFRGFSPEIFGFVCGRITSFLPEFILSHSTLLMALSKVEGPVEGVEMTIDRVPGNRDTASKGGDGYSLILCLPENLHGRFHHHPCLGHPDFLLQNLPLGVGLLGFLDHIIDIRRFH